MKVHSYARSLGCLSNIGRSTAIDYSRSSGGLTKLVFATNRSMLRSVRTMVESVVRLDSGR